MSNFRLTFNTTNAAFTGDPHGEIARILRATADYISRWDTFPGPQHLRDSNGNTVGYWTWEAPTSAVEEESFQEVAK